MGVEPTKDENYGFPLNWSSASRISCRPVYDMFREVEYELGETGKLRICEKDTTFLQYEVADIAVFLLTDLMENCDDDLLFFVAALLEIDGND